MTGSYLSDDAAREELKQYVSLTNQDFIQWFANKVSQSNRQVENDLAIAYITPPTDTSSADYKGFGDAALAWIVYQWKLKQGVLNIDSYARAYDNIISGLKSLAKSKPDTNRLPAMSISQDPRDAKMILPSQANILAFDNFA
jgi:hypothetical protein